MCSLICHPLELFKEDLKTGRNLALGTVTQEFKPFSDQPSQ